MIRNFLHILKAFKTSSMLNLLGLSAGIFIFLIVAMQVYYDLTFNASIPYVESIYQVVKKESTEVEETYIRGFHSAEGEFLKNRFPEIEAFCFINGGGYVKEMVFKVINEQEKEEYRAPSTVVSEGFKEVFQPIIIEGSIEEAFSGPGNTLISESTARQMFGAESPVGKVVELQMFEVVEQKDADGNVIGAYTTIGYKPFTIKAVYKDYGENASINDGFITYRSLLKGFIYQEFYVGMQKQNVKQWMEKAQEKEVMDQMNFWDMNPDKDRNLNVEKTTRLELLPLRNIQINYPTVSLKGQDKSAVFFLFSIGLLALLIAYINFVNFATAMAPARVRSVNIRMILGSAKRQIQLIIASEALFFTLCALLVAIVGILLIQGTPLVQLFKADIRIDSQWGIVAGVGVLLLLLSLLLGIHPAYYITNFNPLLALNSSSSIGVRSSKLRAVLMVVQLFVAVCFVIIALFINRQHHYLVNYSVGFDKENILLLTTKDADGSLLHTDIKTFNEEVIRNPTIIDFTASQGVIGKDWRNYTYMNSDETGRILIWYQAFVLNNFLSFFNIPVIKGTEMEERIEKEKAQVVVNEEFLILNQIENGLQGLSDDPLLKGHEVVGVVQNFHYASLLNSIGSLMILEGEINNLPYLYFKVPQGHLVEARKHIEDTWKKFSDKEIQLEFLDDQLEQLYQSQANLAHAISIVSLIIILIAIMGVFGLITFQTKYKTKEIAIRKVNGAEVKGILYLLNRGLFVQYLIGCLLAIPVVYYVVELWLEQFPYKIGITPWLFVLGALIVLVITLITVTLQSYRAATANPVESLKSE